MVKYEVVSLDMTNEEGTYRVLFSGGLFDGYIVFKKNGELFKADTKADMEDYFNTRINQLLTFLRGKNKGSDW
jgi:hypothetical protein